MSVMMGEAGRWEVGEVTGDSVSAYYPCLTCHLLPSLLLLAHGSCLLYLPCHVCLLPHTLPLSPSPLYSHFLTNPHHPHLPYSSLSLISSIQKHAGQGIH